MAEEVLGAFDIEGGAGSPRPRDQALAVPLPLCALAFGSTLAATLLVVAVDRLFAVSRPVAARPCTTSALPFDWSCTAALRNWLWPSHARLGRVTGQAPTPLCISADASPSVATSPAPGSGAS
jgi:hypothetical protein